MQHGQRPCLKKLLTNTCYSCYYNNKVDIISDHVVKEALYSTRLQFPLENGHRFKPDGNH